MSFEEMSIAAVRTYLEEKGISESICDIFENNEIDGQALLELTAEDLKSLLPDKLGAVKKLSRLISKELSVVTDSTNTPSMAIQSSPSASLFSEASSASTLSLTPKMCKSSFCLPENWRPSIKRCMSAETELKKRQKLTPDVRNEIVRDIVTSMFSFAPEKPDRGFCTRVSKMLVKKYPFLKDIGTTASGYGSWEKKIMECVNNRSKKRPRDIDSDESSPTAKRGRPKSAAASLITRYPPVQEGNVDETLIAALKAECKKDNPRKDVALPLAKKTFATRRNYIIQEAKSVAAIISKYQELRLFFVMEQEVDIVMEKKDVFKTGVSDWSNKWVPAISAYGENCNGKVARISIGHIKDLYPQDDERTEKIALTLLAKFLLPKDKKKKDTDIEPLLEALSVVYSEYSMTDDLDEVALETTSIKVACFTGNKYYLIVEKEVLMEVDTFSEALMTWFIAHYVFHLEYDVNIRMLALFFQEFVFGLPSSAKKSSTYLSVCSDIQAFTAK